MKKRMKLSRTIRRSVIYFLAFSLVVNAWLPAALAEVVLQPDGVINGDIDVTPLNGGITQEMTASNGAIGHFSDFDILAGHSVNCVQPSSSSNALFRVFSGDGTQIYGSFDANGNIFLIDPAGILFGEGSQINVNQLIASSLDITNQDFLDGNYEFKAAGGYAGSVTNNGAITAAEGVALIGSKVLNTGTITTGEGGFVVMAAGDRVLLGEPGSSIVVEMESVTVSEEGDGDVINDGSVESESGTVVLAAGDMFSAALEIDDVSKVSGGVGRIEQNGTIDTSGISGDGGQVIMTAANETVLSGGSVTKANAGNESDSGLVVVHSKGLTTVKAGAKIEATGGFEPYNIDGDFDDVVDTSVEISGDYVNFAGDVDASASEGKRGKIIIDALDMTIADGYMTDTPPDNTVYEKWIEDRSYASTDVELVSHSKTAGNIIAEPISDGAIEGGSGDIVLRTKYDTGGIEFMQGAGGDRTAIRTTEGGNVYMLAGEGGIAVGDIISTVPQHAPEPWIVEPGKIRLLTTNYGDIETGELAVEGGSYDEISVIACGDLLVNGDATTYAHQVDEDLEVGQARTCLVSKHGDVEINGAVTVEAHAKYESTADIHIDAGREIRIDLGGGQLRATALTSSEGTANASVLLHAGKDPELAEEGNIVITNPKSPETAIYLRAQTQGSKAEIYSDGQDPLVEIEVTDGENDESKAILELDEKHTDDCPECPKPPGQDTPQPPTTFPDTFTTHMGNPVTGNVLDNDTLPQGEEIMAYVVDDPEHGVLTDFDPETGDYTYQPEEGFVGEDSFTYITTDGELFSETATVTINVTNTLPSLVDDTATTMQDVAVIIDVLANDFDPDGDPISVISFDYKGSGKLVLNDDGTFSFTPGQGFSGQVSFTYSAADPQTGAELGSAGVTITVNPAPVVVMPPYIPPAPIERIEFNISGCPALVKWATAELGMDEKTIQVQVANTTASTLGIQPCESLEKLKNVAAILRDDGGTRVAALANVIGGLASNTAPPTPEQMASIASAIASNAQTNNDYAVAGEYVDAFAEYVGILESELGFSRDKSVIFAIDNYLEPLIEAQGVGGITYYLSAKLVELSGS